MDRAMWMAIVQCDPAYDGRFFYAVSTTRIYCRPSCRSRTPKPENVRIFFTREEAVAAGYRACKRCRPDQPAGPDEELVQRATAVIANRYQEPLTLPRLASLLHVSPYHLHRVFKRLTGRTPTEHLRRTRIAAAQRLLAQPGGTITDVAMATGFISAAHFATSFQKLTGCTPTEYRAQRLAGRLRPDKEDGHAEHLRLLEHVHTP